MSRESGNKTASSPEPELSLFPGMWRFPRNPELCCIYRVPNCIRDVKPEAYTPQLVLIGPLHHSVKSHALKSLGLGNNIPTKSTGYLNTEEHKKIYLAEFAQRVEGEKTIDGFRRIIEEDEEIIRASYSESTAWIESPEFVKMILHDSVFIIEFLLRASDTLAPEKEGDPLMDEGCLQVTVMRDLILLENQLPYFILEKLFNPIIPRISPNQTFQELIITGFGLEDDIRKHSKFIHFTDMCRCFHVGTLPEDGVWETKPIKQMYNADKLDRGGVKFEAGEEEFPFYVRFENGCLKMPCLKVDDSLETMLRNIMALEQCHYPYDTQVCDYISFLDYLIDTDKDVDLLVEKGMIQNGIGKPSLVADMVNNLCLGTIQIESHYSDISDEVTAYYSNPVNKACAVLKRVYFGNLWTGTATMAATLLLVMTLIQTVASIIQVMQNQKVP